MKIKRTSLPLRNAGPSKEDNNSVQPNESLIKKLLSYAVLTQNSYVAICSIQQ